MAARGKRNTTMTLAKYRVGGNDRELGRCCHTLTGELIGADRRSIENLKDAVVDRAERTYISKRHPGVHGTDAAWRPPTSR
jgi:hypothetical protein